MQGVLDGVVVEPLLIEHHVRLDHPAAGAAGHALRFEDIVQAVGLSALHAVVAQDAAVQLADVAAAGLLMEAVDVLGDDGGQLAPFLPAGQLFVSGVRFCVRAEHLFTVKTVELLRMVQEKMMAQNLLRRPGVMLVIQPVHAAEIRDSALGGHARPAKKHDMFGFPDPSGKQV